MGKVRFHQEEADDAIVRFCGSPDWQDKVVVPLVSLGDKKASNGHRKVTQITGGFPINGGVDNLWLDVSFAESSCIGKFQFDQAKCLLNLRSILNNCDNAGLFPKRGGLIRDVCSVYRMSAGPASDPDPNFLLWSDPRTRGEFTCTDTDISVLGPDSPLAGTCTCWYSGMESVTDVFDKPEGGCSTVQSSSNPKTN
jgi:hypothetical protein